MKRPLTCLLLMTAGSVFAYSESVNDFDSSIKLFTRDGGHWLLPRTNGGGRKSTPQGGGRTSSPLKSLASKPSGLVLPKSPFDQPNASPARSRQNSGSLPNSLFDSTSGPVLPQSPISQRSSSPPKSGSRPESPPNPFLSASSSPFTPPSAFRQDDSSPFRSRTRFPDAPTKGSKTPGLPSQGGMDTRLQRTGTGHSSGLFSDSSSPSKSILFGETPPSAFRGGPKAKQSVKWKDQLTSGGTAGAQEASPFATYTQSALKRSGRNTGSSSSLAVDASRTGSSPPLNLPGSKSVPTPLRMSALSLSSPRWPLLSSPESSPDNARAELRSSKPSKSKTARDPEHEAHFGGGEEFKVFEGRHSPVKSYDHPAAQKLVDDHVDALIDLDQKRKDSI